MISVFISMIDETVLLGENTFVVVCLYDFQSKITSVSDLSRFIIIIQITESKSNEAELEENIY